MNFLNNRTLLRELLQQGDLMNTVNGGIRETTFRTRSLANGIIVEVSNPSLFPEAFNFTIHKDELLVNVMHMTKEPHSDHVFMFPAFFKTIKIPYNVDFKRIEAIYEHGIFKVFMPFNTTLPGDPFRVQVRNLDK
ncbi:MAG: Hsp20/alpha crystallin family protein [Cyclobacteriaceae bacterium]|nr:Hsp20/alpha crystallin family protein [Cyclobacteriaceae bacterium]